jgi:Uma2 family endonuclease
MQVAEKIDKISPEEYLQDELLSEFKHELIDGEAYAMAGTSKNHERIAMNLGYEFNRHLKNSLCEPFGSGMKVRVGDNFFILM